MGVHCHATSPHEGIATVAIACVDAGSSVSAVAAVPDPTIVTTSCDDRALSMPPVSAVASSMTCRPLVNCGSAAEQANPFAPALLPHRASASGDRDPSTYAKNDNLRSTLSEGAD